MRKIIKYKLLSSLIFVIGLSAFLLPAAFAGEIPVNTVPSSIVFIDSNHNKGSISGTISWAGLSDETNVSVYQVYFLDSAGYPFTGSLIGTVTKGGDYSITLSDRPIPEGAAKIGIRAGASKGCGG